MINDLCDWARVLGVQTNMSIRWHLSTILLNTCHVAKKLQFFYTDVSTCYMLRRGSKNTVRIVLVHFWNTFYFVFTTFIWLYKLSVVKQCVQCYFYLEFTLTRFSRKMSFQEGRKRMAWNDIIPFVYNLKPTWMPQILACHNPNTMLPQPINTALN